MDIKNFGWAVIGCGAIAEKAAKQLQKAGAGKIVAVWNRTKSRAEKFSAKYGGKVFSTAEEAVKGEGVNCVYVAVTHDKHAYYTSLAINAGVPVLCEKPLTVNAKQTEELLALAKQKNVYLAEAMWTWHNPVTLKVKEWIESGAVGEIKKVKAVFSFPMMHINKNPRLVRSELAGGVLLDLGIYNVRYVYGLFGLPKSINCNGRLLNGIDTDNHIIMDYGNFKAELCVSMRKFAGEKVVIKGADGKIVVPYFHTAHTAKLKGKKSEKVKSGKYLFGLEFKHTAEDILSGKKESGYCPQFTTLDNMNLLDECRKQMCVIYPCEM